MRKSNTQNGITLVALIITIVILLILAVVVIRAVQGDGIISYAQRSKQTTEKSEVIEKIKLAVMAAKISSEGELTEENLNTELEKKFAQDYEVIPVGKSFIIVVQDIQYKTDGTIIENKEINIENPGDLTKGGRYDGQSYETAYRINCIEDLVEWSNNYNNYKSSYIILEETLDFENPFSYNDYKKEVSKDINGNNEKESIITEMTTGFGFNPIYTFAGKFYGEGNKLSNIYINRTGNVGFFAGIGANGLIENFGISGVITSTNGSAGSIAAALNDGAYISNCYSECTVNAYNYAAGIAASASVNIKTYFVNCYNTGNITSENSYAAGIVAFNHGSAVANIYNCYNNGQICGKSYSGGIWGSGHAVIYNCFNIGNIISPRSGGIAGYQNSGKLENIYNVGTITSTSEVLPAGIVSWIYGWSVNLDNAYYLDNVSIAQALNGFEWTCNSVGRGSSTSEYLQSQEFVDKLNEYVENYEASRAEDSIPLRKWKYNKGNYPTFE